MKEIPLKDKAFIVLCIAGSLFIVTAGALIIYWLLIDDNPPITVNNAPLPITTSGDVYRPGDDITFELDFCRHTTGAIRFTRRWVDGLMFIEPEQHVSGGNVECIKRSLVATVPEIPPGVYHVEYNVIYSVNPLADRAVTFITQDFEVVEP